MTRVSGSSVSGIDYFADATKRGVMKWIPSRMPLSVYIEPKSTARNFQPSFADDAKSCFADWAAASQGKVDFKFVDQPDGADIKLGWSDNPNEVAQPAEGGEAKVVPGTNGIKSVSIKVLTLLPVKELKVDDALIHFICMHEVGHSLGIIGHSQNRGDIMYCSLPLNFESCALSNRDAKTLQHLYSDEVVAATNSSNGIAASQEESALDDKARKEIANGNTQEALRLYKEARTKYPNSQLLKHNYACAINQAGLGEMNAQKYEAAADRFKEALTVDPNDNTAKINLGIALMNSGTMQSLQGHFPEAEPFYKEAVELLAASNNQTMLTTAVHNYSKYLSRVGRSSEAQQLEAKYLKH